MSMIIDSKRSDELQQGLASLHQKLENLSKNSEGPKRELLNSLIKTAVSQNKKTESNDEGANHVVRYLKPMSTHQVNGLKMNFNKLINIVDLPTAK